MTPSNPPSWTGKGIRWAARPDAGPAGATADPELAAYATAAKATVSDRVDASKPGLIDLRAERHWTVIDDLLALAMASMAQGAFAQLHLDFADGHLVSLVRSQRWRFWKPAFKGFA